MRTFTAGVLTVSDTCAAGTATDTSGPHLQELLTSNFTPTVVKYELVPDDMKKIEVRWYLKNFPTIFSKY